MIPSLSETAATPGLVGWRFAAFVAMMLAIGLFAFRMLIARPVLRAVPGTSLRPVTTAFIVALAVSLVSVPIYLIVSTAKFALRSWYDLGTLIPLVRASGFGRSYLDLWILARAVRRGGARRDRDRPPDAVGALGRRAARDRRRG